MVLWLFILFYFLCLISAPFRREHREGLTKTMMTLDPFPSCSGRLSASDRNSPASLREVKPYGRSFISPVINHRHRFANPHHQCETERDKFVWVNGWLRDAFPAFSFRFFDDGKRFNSLCRWTTTKSWCWTFDNNKELILNLRRLHVPRLKHSRKNYQC